MQKTFVFFLITLAVSVMGIVLAYSVGRQSTEQRLEAEILRTQEDQKAVIAQLQHELTLASAQAPAAAPAPAPIIATPEPPTPTETAAPSIPAAPETETKAPETEIAVVTPPPAPVVEEPAAVKTEPAVVETAPTVVEKEPAVVETEPAATEPAPAMVETKPSPPADSPAVEKKPAPRPAKPKAIGPPLAPIARESFDAVALNTAYKEVAKKLGRNGVVVFTMEETGGKQTQQYVWQWTGTAGKTCRVNMQFVNGLLTEKTYRE